MSSQQPCADCGKPADGYRCVPCFTAIKARGVTRPAPTSNKKTSSGKGKKLRGNPEVILREANKQRALVGLPAIKSLDQMAHRS